jgi:hypothetical protein
MSFNDPLLITGSLILYVLFGLIGFRITELFDRLACWMLDGKPYVSLKTRRDIVVMHLMWPLYVAIALGFLLYATVVLIASPDDEAH